MDNNKKNKPPQLWMIVGGNGSGKSTFYKYYLETLGFPFVNTDEIAKELFPNDPEGRSIDAAKIAGRTGLRYLDTGKSFCFETVFSHPSKIDFMANAKAMGYEVIMVYIHLSSTNLNKARVHHRVQHGGHSVPEEKIESRISRSLNNAIAASPLCDYVKMLDNSDNVDRFKPVLTIRDGKKERHFEILPAWTEEF